MKKISLSAIALASLFLHTGCERHSASQTVPGFDEQQADRRALQQKKASVPLTTNPEAPRFFPPATGN